MRKLQVGEICLCKYPTEFNRKVVIVEYATGYDHRVYWIKRLDNLPWNDMIDPRRNNNMEGAFSENFLGLLPRKQPVKEFTISKFCKGLI